MVVDYMLLLDTGASDLLIRNARELDIDLGDVDVVFQTMKGVMGDQLQPFYCGQQINL